MLCKLTTERRNSVVEPLDDNAPVELPVDISILCLPGATGRHVPLTVTHCPLTVQNSFKI